jgi:nicotinate-nucleotide adenylyltransferase
VTTPGPVGILGGTFDPIHHAHLRLAHEAWMACGLAQVRFIPSATPPHRAAPGADASHRLAMVELAIAGNPAFVADRRELDRDMPSYTIDTVAGLRTDLGADRPLCVIVGADAFALFETWRRWRELLDAVHLIVAHRPGFAIVPGTTALAAEFAARRTDDPAALRDAPGGRILPLAITALDIAASRIRADLAAGRSPRYLLPDAVVGYIDAHCLYPRGKA